MRVYGLYDDEIRQIAQEVGLGIWNDRNGGGVKRRGGWLQFRLGLGPRPFRFQKLNRYRQGTAFVCWHGHREFLNRLFGRFPEATVETSLAWYQGRDHFLRSHARTYGRGNYFNLSSEWRCRCDYPDLSVNRNPFRRRGRRVVPREVTVEISPAIDWSAYAEQFSNTGATLRHFTEAVASMTDPIRTTQFSETQPSEPPSSHQPETPDLDLSLESLRRHVFSALDEPRVPPEHYPPWHPGYVNRPPEDATEQLSDEQASETPSDRLA